MPKTYKITENLYSQLRDEENGGICRSCGHIHHSGCEPDARNYPCENCQWHEVFGIEEALIMGLIELTSEDEDDEDDDTM